MGSSHPKTMEQTYEYITISDRLTQDGLAAEYLAQTDLLVAEFALVKG